MTLSIATFFSFHIYVSCIRYKRRKYVVYNIKCEGGGIGVVDIISFHLNDTKCESRYINKYLV